MTTQTEALSIVDTMKLALEALEGMQNAIYNIGGEHVIDLNYAVEKADVAEQTITAIKEALNRGAMDSSPNGEAQPAVALEQRSVRTSVDSEHLDPVADFYVTRDMATNIKNLKVDWTICASGSKYPTDKKVVPVFVGYTTPPQHSAIARSSSATPRKPLTDEQTIILKGATCPEIDWKARHFVEMNNGERNEWMLEWFMAFKVAIEAAHGIKENT